MSKTGCKSIKNNKLSDLNKSENKSKNSDFTVAAFEC